MSDSPPPVIVSDSVPLKFKTLKAALLYPAPLKEKYSKGKLKWFLGGVHNFLLVLANMVRIVCTSNCRNVVTENTKYHIGINYLNDTVSPELSGPHIKRTNFINGHQLGSRIFLPIFAEIEPVFSGPVN